NFETATAAVPLHWFAGIGQSLQFAEDETRDNERSADEAGGPKVSYPPVDDHVTVEDKRLTFHCLASKTDIRNDEREFVAIAPHRQHHAEIGESGVNNEADNPLRRFRLEAQHF